MDSSINKDEFLGSDDLNVWKQLARNDPASPALLPLARTYLFREEPARALEISQRVFSAHPYHIEAATLTARALVELRRIDDARAVLRDADLTLSNMADFIEELARLFAAVGDDEVAARAAQAVEILRVASPASYPEWKEGSDERYDVDAGAAIPTETMAALYLGQGHTDKAIEIYRLLVDQNPGNERLKSKLADLLGEDALALVDEEMDDGEPGIEPATETDILGAAREVEATEELDADWEEEELPPLDDMEEELETDDEDGVDWAELIPSSLDEMQAADPGSARKPMEPEEEADWADLIPPTLRNGADSDLDEVAEPETMTDDLIVLKAHPSEEPLPESSSSRPPLSDTWTLEIDTEEDETDFDDDLEESAEDLEEELEDDFEEDLDDEIGEDLLDTAGGFALPWEDEPEQEPDTETETEAYGEVAASLEDQVDLAGFDDNGLSYAEKASVEEDADMESDWAERDEAWEEEAEDLGWENDTVFETASRDEEVDEAETEEDIDSWTQTDLDDGEDSSSGADVLDDAGDEVWDEEEAEVERAVSQDYLDDFAPLGEDAEYGLTEETLGSGPAGARTRLVNRLERLRQAARRRREALEAAGGAR